MAAMSVAELKSQSRAIPYSSLAREPKNYVGNVVKFQGKVIQAVESGSNVTLLVNVTPKTFGSWSDPVYVDYRKASDSELIILDNDLVSFWGKYIGIKSYQAIRGNTVQIPHIVAKVVENVEGAEHIVPETNY
jgi:hypothetical protein